MTENSYSSIMKEFQSGKREIEIPFNIFLSDDVGDEEGFDTSSQLLYWDEQNEHEKQINPIILHINSFGGDVYEMHRIVDVMKGIPTPVITYCSGKAMSAAAYILAHGDARFISPNSWVMLHSIQSWMEGSAHDIKIEHNHVITLQRRFVEKLAAATGQTKKKIESVTDRDHYFDADAAVAFGLVDEIAEDVPKTFCAKVKPTRTRKKTAKKTTRKKSK